MTRKLPLLVLFFQFALFAQEPIFSPTSSIAAFGSVSSPSGEDFSKIIDGNINTKYLDFNESDGLGFTVNLNGVLKSATSMALTTANDSPERDPMNYQISGSIDGINYTVIATGSITCINNRFNTRTFNFANTAAYSYYRLVFSNQCNTIESMLQVAEVQLFHTPLSNATFEKNDFAVYPNPTNGTFIIQSKDLKTIDVVTISDALGKQIKQVKVNGTTKSELNLNGIASGIYFVQITSGSENVVKKIIIK